MCLATEGALLEIDNYSIKTDSYLHMKVGYVLRMKQMIMDRCRFFCMRPHQLIFNPGGYEDHARSNLAVTTIQDTGIHYITYQKYKYPFFYNEKEGGKRATFEHL